MGTRFDSFYRNNTFDTRKRNNAFDVYGLAGVPAWELDHDFTATTPRPYELCVFNNDLYVACGYGVPWYIKIYKRNGGAYDLFLSDGTNAYTVCSQTVTMMPFDGKLYLNVCFTGAFFIGRVINGSSGTWSQENGEYIGGQSFRQNGNYLFWARHGRSGGSTWVALKAPVMSDHLNGRFTFQNVCVNYHKYWPGTGDTLSAAVAFGGSTFPTALKQMGSDGSYMYGVSATTVLQLNSFVVGWAAMASQPSIGDFTRIANLACHYYGGILYVAQYVRDDDGITYMLIHEWDGASWSQTHQYVVNTATESSYCWFQEFSGYMYVCAFERIFRKELGT